MNLHKMELDMTAPRMNSDILAGLNDRQREAVEAIDGPLLIVAGPGSGKTRLITARIAYLLRVVGISPGRIAAVTFTNKAAREMRDRVESVASYDAPRLSMGTFHAFCARALRQDGEVIGLDPNFGIYDDADQLDTIKRSMAELDVDSKQFSPRAVLSAVSGAKSQLLSADGFKMRAGSYFEEVVGRVYERYEIHMARADAVDFDDLLLKTYFLLSQRQDVAEKYQDRFVHFMIDEFQDTNVAQYEIARVIAQKHRNLCVVGDPDQSIYSWRNADIRNILSFQKDFPDAKVVALEQNYRSTQTILDAASRLISANSQRVEKELFTNNGRGVPIEMAEGYDDEEEAQFVLREVVSLTRANSDGPPQYRLGDIAVMYRVNAQSRALEESCLRYGIPYQVVGGMKFYQRREVKDLAAYLKLINNPRDDASLLRVINTPTRGIGRRTLDELRRLARDSEVSMFDAIQQASPDTLLSGPSVSRPFTPRAARALVAFREIIVSLQAEIESVNLVELIDNALDKSGYRKFLANSDDRADELLDNINEFKNATRDYLHLPTSEGLNAFMESVALVSDVDSMEDKPDSLTLITLHQAKGLEYPVVFMVGMEDGLLPHSRSRDDPAALEEERRLCYVGMTRAKERLYLLRAFRRGFRGGSGPNMPSRFLLDIPQKLVSRSDASDPAPEIAPRQRPGNGASRLKRSSVRPGADRVGGQSDGFSFSRRSRPNPVESSPARRSGRRASPSVRRRGRPNSTDAMVAPSTGDKVRHATFGEGIVMSCEPSGSDFEVTVAFSDGGGVKKLLLGMARLEKIE